MGTGPAVPVRTAVGGRCLTGLAGAAGTVATGMPLATAKVFTTGNSQAIRLPKAFRLDAEEGWINKSKGGILTIQPKPRPDELEAFLAELQSMPQTKEFLLHRDDAPRPSPFEGWEQ